MANDLSFWHKERLEEILSSNQSKYDKTVSLASLMTALEHANTGNRVLNVQQSELGEFYRKVKYIRDEWE